MKRSTELDVIKRVLSYVAEKSTDMADTTSSLPVSRYFDSTRFEAEQKLIFGQLPRAVGHISQIPDTGDFFTLEAGEQPVLIVRTQGGGVNAFLNVCRHRGARLEWDAGGCGRKRFTCKYHGWVYNPDGALVGIPGQEGFPQLNRDIHGLTRLPVEVRHGFIWIHPDPKGKLDVGDYLGDLDAELAGFDLDTHVQFSLRRFTKKINWKLVIDTFLESYHVRTAHKDTIAPMFFDNIGLADRFEPHQRIIFPKLTISDLADQPEESWSLRQHANILYVLFPNTMILVQPDHMGVFHGYADGIDGVVVDACALIPEAPVTDKAANYWQKNVDILFSALDEDFALAESVQAGVKTAANDHLTFGRMEKGLGWFHQNIDQIVDGKDQA
jgi:phenylpropionate dioxygenase-like ring-hydroxylating dioxygenase large terminal subunit